MSTMEAAMIRTVKKISAPFTMRLKVELEELPLKIRALSLKSISRSPAMSRSSS